MHKRRDFLKAISLLLSGCGGGAAGLAGTTSTAGAGSTGTTTPASSPPPPGGACSRLSGSTVWTASSSTSPAGRKYQVTGNYLEQFNDWGPLPGGYTMWVNDQACWGVTGVTQNTDWSKAYPRCAPSAGRGWTGDPGKYTPNGGLLPADWPVRSGMGLSVTALGKSKLRWSISQAPTALPSSPGHATSRWDALIDVYLDTQPNPPGADSASANPYFSYTDIQIYQWNMDDGTYWNAANIGPGGSCHPCLKTIGGVQYVVVINAYRADRGYGAGVKARAASCTPSFFPRPVAGWDTGGTMPYLQGKADVTHDIKGMIDWLRSTSSSAGGPADDNGNPIFFADGRTVTSALISDDLYLTGISSGFEINFTGSPSDAWVTGEYWIAMQNEADGP